MSTITFSLTKVPEAITGEEVYRANVQTNGTVTADQLAAAIAEKTKQAKSLAAYFITALNEELAKQILAGYRVNLGQLSTGFTIKGAFASEDERWDPKRHTLVPTIRTLDPLKSALAAVKPNNIVVGLVCSVYSLMDNVTKRLNCICGSNVVHIQGLNLGIDADNPDEGVSLVDENGVVKATATVTRSDAQSVDCSFPTPPEPGVYTLVVACRNGNRTSLAPAVGELKNVTVVPANA